MPSLSWFAWALVVLSAYLAISVTIDVLCRRFFPKRQIGGMQRPQPRIKRWKLTVLFLVNTLQVSTALFLAAQFRERGWGGLYESTVASTADVVWIAAQAFLLLVIYDTNFYWAHRLAHRYKKLFARIHAEHHRPKYPNVWHLQYQHPLDYFVTTAAPLAWVALLPLPLSTQGYLLSVALAAFINIAGHCGFEISGTVIGLPTFHGWAARLDPRRLWVAKLFNNVLHHDLHHQRFTGNFSLYFTWWDRLCGTFDADTDDLSLYTSSRSLPNGMQVTKSAVLRLRAPQRERAPQAKSPDDASVG